MSPVSKARFAVRFAASKILVRGKLLCIVERLPRDVTEKCSIPKGVRPAGRPSEIKSDTRRLRRASAVRQTSDFDKRRISALGRAAVPRRFCANLNPRLWPQPDDRRGSQQILKTSPRSC